MELISKNFLVHYKSHVKKVKNPTKDMLRQIFKVNPSVDFFVQHYDNEFQTYVDIEWSEIFETNSVKLKICVEDIAQEVKKSAEALEKDQGKESLSVTSDDTNDQRINVNKSILERQEALLPLSKEDIKVVHTNIKEASIHDSLSEGDPCSQIFVTDCERSCKNLYLITGNDALEVIEKESYIKRSDNSESNMYNTGQSSTTSVASTSSITAVASTSSITAVASTSSSTAVASTSSITAVASTSSITAVASTSSLECSFSDTETSLNVSQRCFNKTIEMKSECYPSSYVLSVIHPNSKLGKALNQKQTLSKALKSDFLTKIYESFSANNDYYIMHGYDEIACSILNAYPYLGQELPFSSAKHLWMKSLGTKFCNERRRTDAKVDAVLKRKKSWLQKETTKVQRIQTIPNILPVSNSSICFGIANYHPTASISEDEKIAIDSHKKWMKSEMKEAHRNMAGISLRMGITYSDRRSLLFARETGAPTNNLAADILKQYPCLTIEEQAVEEMQRIFGENDGKYLNYVRRIKYFSEKLQEEVRSSKSKYRMNLNELFQSSNSQNVESCVLYKCIGNVSILLSENPSDLISASMNDNNAPMLRILNTGDVEVNVDRTTFIHNVSAKNSTFLWLLSFYIFNIKPVANKRTFDVLQHLIFRVPKKAKVISKFN